MDKLILWYDTGSAVDPRTGEQIQVQRPVTVDELVYYGDLDNYIDSLSDDGLPLKLLYDLNAYGWQFVDNNGWVCTDEE